MQNDNGRRFSTAQDRTYAGEWINNRTKWANTKVVLLPTFTVYELVGRPAYETPVFTGTKAQCAEFVAEQSK